MGGVSPLLLWCIDVIESMALLIGALAAPQHLHDDRTPVGDSQAWVS